MKTLDSVLTQRSEPYFPIRGKNGYGGEQDGSIVLFANFDCGSRTEAKKILIPEKAKLHWARYTSFHGWDGAVGIWDDQFSEDEDQKSPLFFE